MSKYPEYKSLNLPQIGKDILAWWERENIFERSVSEREGKDPFVFYEGPPSANGMPGIHHVMARTIKDLFCRYQTLKGKQVRRKAGWDTHGLPIELAVEKTLGITKEDIGKKISIEEYNKACRKEVMKYQDKWEELTRIMGYWVDMEHPYITYDNSYIESVWWLLRNLYDKQLLYKGYTIQPYSPAAGTGLSTHELNQPGCYRNVKDTSIVAQFKVTETAKLPFKAEQDVFFLAWTTTPWTLPANCALAIGESIDYVAVKTFNPYSHRPVTVILAKDLLGKYFPQKNAELKLEEYKAGDKHIPFRVVAEFKGRQLIGIHYEQLLPFVQPSEGDAFRVIPADFVTTEDGTGIVHTASVFGADDFRACKLNNVPSILVKDEDGNWSPLVDKRGRFVKEVYDRDWGLAGEYVKREYLSKEEEEKDFREQKERLKKFIPELKEYLSVDERIALKLKLEGKAFKIEKYEHSYPHCWRTDKPVLYYPLDSWFVKVTACRERLAELNRTINWKPEHTGTGRFGEWLNNLQDWNLSRSRFWGIPLPVWRTDDGKEEKCIGSVEELKREVEKAEAKGISSDFSFGNDLDLHKPYIDRIVLVSDSGRKMYRENDLIDVWFDSGAMPYAQIHYPFENRELIDEKRYFPADFIAEGVDQTRGWFYTLHAIATLCFDSVAYKNVVSNGLVLDKNGNKMSKRLGNAVDPFDTLDKFGPDATRWYMITNASPWDNLKFDIEGVKEKQTGFFSTLYNTYSFFALYANIDRFQIDEQNIVPVEKRSELDRWIISRLHSLVETVTRHMDDYDPTPAGRAIEEFVDEHLSNWYVRLSRRRFWKPARQGDKLVQVAGGGEMSEDKKAAYETLYECLMVVSQLMSPIAPFFADWLYRNLSDGVRGQAKKYGTPLSADSVHLSLLTRAEKNLIDKELEQRMDIAQKVTSMILSIRKKENIRVRQPLHKVRIPVLDESFRKRLEGVKELILSEVNVKEIEFVNESDTQIVKNLKLNFKTLGKKCGKDMKAVQAYAAEHAQSIILAMERTGRAEVQVNGTAYTLENEDVEIIPVDIPGWKVANQGMITVALDVTITPRLREEGIARELVNRIQNMRKDKGLEVTDKISLTIQSSGEIDASVSNNKSYICSETLASSLEIVKELSEKDAVLVEVDENIKTL
ncbi:MAG: isoleucine--tRNA ligase, partial [Bacteroidota bacterium]